MDGEMESIGSESPSPSLSRKASELSQSNSSASSGVATPMRHATTLNSLRRSAADNTHRHEELTRRMRATAGGGLLATSPEMADLFGPAAAFGAGPAAAAAGPSLAASAPLSVAAAVDEAQAPLVEPSFALAASLVDAEAKAEGPLVVDYVRSYVDDLEPQFLRVRVDGEAPVTEEVTDASVRLLFALELRAKYMLPRPDWPYTVSSHGPQPSMKPLEDAVGEFACALEDGVFVVRDRASGRPLVPVVSHTEFYGDLRVLMETACSPIVKSQCFKRLKLLRSRFEMHMLLNEQLERDVQRQVPHRDFYNVRKVDTHVHHSASMNEKHLLKFIKRMLRDNPDEVVIERNGAPLSLKQVFESIELKPYHLSINTLDMHADKSTFHRFDRFNLKYNPVGQSRLREIFLKTDNFVQGRFLAGITRELIANLEESKYQQAEWRLSIYGRSPDEWSKLAHWVIDNGLVSDRVRWMIQVPRLYQIYRSGGTMASFAQLLQNVFGPVFDVTMNPASDPVLHKFLFYIVGFDSVDDESKTEKPMVAFPLPQDWDVNANPPYSYYIFYMWANLRSLNTFRARRGLNTFSLRPHSGEAGELDHVATAFMLATHINHGIVLRKLPVLQYLYYLTQIGLALSPLSNNSLFLAFEKNPLPKFFAIGLNVSISTDDPLQFHITKEPLIEEYSIVQQVWKMSQCDICELARNSVYQSGFERATRQKWLGQRCDLPGTRGNDINRTNVPNIRIKFRQENLLGELAWIRHGAALGASDDLDLRVLDSLVSVYK